MPTVYALLTEKQTFFDANSNELGGGKLFVYLAGTTTKVTTYAETDGISANSNPIVLNSRGEVPNGLYVEGGNLYKLVLSPSTDTDPPTSPIWTRDDLSPINYVSPSAISEWQTGGVVATQTGASTFTVSGDQRQIFQAGRRVRAVITAPPQFAYGTIYSSSFGAGVTTVTLAPLSAALDGGLTGTMPDVGLLAASNPSVPVLTDDIWEVSDDADRTKRFGVTLSSLTTGTKRTRTPYDKSGYDVVASDIWGLHNAVLTATVAANSLILSLATNTGASASAADPAFVGFRSATAAAGVPGIIGVTGAVSLTFAAASSLGFANGEAGRIWVCAINNAGTVELAAYRAWDGNNVLVFNEEILTTTAEGGGTATSAQVLYSATARAGVPMRYLGYIEIQRGTNQWSNAPTFVQTNHSRMPLPGELRQVRYVRDGAYATNAGTIPSDDTIPQNTEGAQYMSLAVTPTSAVNLLRVESAAYLSCSGAAEYMSMALFRDSGADAIAATQQSMNSADPSRLALQYQGVAGSVSSTTFAVRAGGTASTTYFNGYSGARKLGGVLESHIRISELMT